MRSTVPSSLVAPLAESSDTFDPPDAQAAIPVANTSNKITFFKKVSLMRWLEFRAFDRHDHPKFGCKGEFQEILLEYPFWK